MSNSIKRVSSTSGGAGQATHIAVDATGVVAFGSNSDSQLGNSSVDMTQTPMPIRTLPLGLVVRKVSNGVFTFSGFLCFFSKASDRDPLSLTASLRAVRRTCCC